MKKHSVNERIIRPTKKRKRRPENQLVMLVIGVIVLTGLFFLTRAAFPSLFGMPIKTTASWTGNTTTGSDITTPSSNTSHTSGSTSLSTTSSSQTTATTAPTATTISSAERAQAFNKAKSDIEALIATYKGRYAIYYQNLVNGEIYSFKANTPFVAASSIKLGINTHLYLQIADEKISPTEILAYDNRPYPTGDYEAGTGIIQSQPNGTKYSVRDTSGLSIRISDNCATNMVIRKLGGIDKVNEYLRLVSGIVDYRKSVSYTNYAGTAVSGRHRTCATDLGLHAVSLYQLYQDNPTVYQPLIDDLCETEFDFGIQKGIPEIIRVAHKIGTNGAYNTENDVGIVFAGEPFVLCVMTESGSASNARRFQAEVARILYQYIDKVT